MRPRDGVTAFPSLPSLPGIPPFHAGQPVVAFPLFGQRPARRAPDPGSPAGGKD